MPGPTPSIAPSLGAPSLGAPLFPVLAEWGPDGATAPIVPGLLLAEVGPDVVPKPEGPESLWSEAASDGEADTEVPLTQDQSTEGTLSQDQSTEGTLTQDQSTEGTMSSEDLPLIFDPFDDVTPQGSSAATGAAAPFPEAAAFDRPVTVETEDGERVTADHVIVTVPLGYLKQHHATLFSPPLPSHKQHSVQRMGFGTNNKIFVEFDSPWWDADCGVIHLLWEDEEDVVDQVADVKRSWIKKLFGFTVVTPAERYGHVLCGWIAGHEAEYMETLTEQEVMREVTQLIRTFTGNPIITPRRVLRSQWFQDPWTCGSYTYPGRGCSAQDLANLREPLPTKGAAQCPPLQVLFAGEATHHCYYSTVHGALLSGWREADRLIAHYSSAGPPEPHRSKL